MPSQSTLTLASNMTTVVAPSQPDILAPTTVEATCKAASTAISDMKTLFSPIQSVVSGVDSANDRISLFLDTLSKFNNIVSEITMVNFAHTV